MTICSTPHSSPAMGNLELSLRPRSGRWPKRGTQNFRLLQHLRNGFTITPLESWTELGIYRLAARINDLRNLGWDIKAKRKKVSSRFGSTATVAEYSL